jgi:hypothetical protein
MEIPLSIDAVLADSKLAKATTESRLHTPIDDPARFWQKTLTERIESMSVKQARGIPLTERIESMNVKQVRGVPELNIRLVHSCVHRACDSHQ